MNPLDLITYHPDVETAIERVFGDMLIAKSHQAATDLAVKYGLPCVTLGGWVSRPGSLRGGWHGPRKKSSTASLVLRLNMLQVLILPLSFVSHYARQFTKKRQRFLFDA
jgi:chromosome segregation ATPase